MNERSQEERCEEARRVIQTRLDGPVSAADAVALEQHLASCEACRSYRTEMEEISSVLRLAPELEFPEEALETVWEQTVRKQAPQRRRWPMWAAATASLAATVLVALLIGYPKPVDPQEAELLQAEKDLAFVLSITRDAMQRGGQAFEEQVLEENVRPAMRRSRYQAPNMFRPTSGEVLR